ncbi:MAG TPA: polysaccharide deacetylase family protein [Terracidiphilus sp.]|jgi:peptidoglycan/xylan/chitin deacetylase (PgdA/CDA1 family)
MFSSVAADVSLALGAAAAVGLAAGGFQYAALWPGSQIFGSALVAPLRPGELALTFDDGPNPAWTPQLIDVLAQHHATATFFLLGRYAEQQPALVQRLVNAGHLIGNHSWSHPNLSVTPAAHTRQELSRTKNMLEQIIGQPVRFFRPPFGARRPVTLRIARDMGMTPVLWNAMTTDWSERSPERITERLVAKIESNQRRGRASNIVLHDGSHERLRADRGPSVATAEKLLARYAATQRFVTLDAWSGSA